MTSDIQRLDILYGKINALEIIAEELFAELLRNSQKSDSALTAISRRSEAVADKLAQTGQLSPLTGLETKESVKRMIQNLSLALAGDMRPRSRGQ